ncbi:hypothetical protein BDR26DRAFT_864278 [Obelidium mucronatum]|nr:hypothetical protein BDR26DRAFT_864278 [Obelidium mucronatum]
MEQPKLFKMPLEHQFHQKPVKKELPPKPTVTGYEQGTRTSDYYACETKLPRRFECPGAWQYEPKKQNPMYMTTSHGYGQYAPTVHEMPNKFYGQSSKFTELMGARISRDFGLNH